MDQVWILGYGYEGQTLGERFSLLRIAQNISMPLPRVCQIWLVFLTICETQSSDNDEDFGNSALTTDADPSRLWRADFKNYIDTLEAKPPAGMTTVQWWGVSIFSSSVRCN